MTPQEANQRLAGDIKRVMRVAENLFKATDHAIRELPSKSMGIAFGLGPLIGVFVGRRYYP